MHSRREDAFKEGNFSKKCTDPDELRFIIQIYVPIDMAQGSQMSYFLSLYLKGLQNCQMLKLNVHAREIYNIKWLIYLTQANFFRNLGLFTNYVMPQGWMGGQQDITIANFTMVIIHKMITKP